jgi:hypothetical protein
MIAEPAESGRLITTTDQIVMPEKSEGDRPSKKPGQVPEQPPKAPPQDYSALPQKPITLKADVDLAPVLKRSSRKSPIKRAISPPIAKKKRQKKSAVKSSPILSEVSEEAREIAISSAERAGIPVNRWLEGVIIATTNEPSAAPSDVEAILQSLEEIKERLTSIENRKGFWRRFWEQYVEPYQK